MTDREENEQAPRPGAAPGRSEATRAEPSPAQTGTPGQDSGVAALRAGNYAGFAVRRVPPPEGARADAPWQIVAADTPYDGSLPQPADAAIGTQPAVPAPRRPVFPPPSALEPLVPPGPDAEHAGPTDPAAQARPGAGGADDRYRDLTKIRSDYTAPLPPDPQAPAGPNPKQMTELVQARVLQGDKRRAWRGRSRQNAATGGGYVKTASTQAALIKRGKGLFARYQRESGVQLREDNVDPRDFATWLFSLKPGLAPSSWRIYRKSALAWVQTVPNAGREEAIAMLEGDVGIGADGGRAKPRSRRGSPVRWEPAKRFGRADFDTVMNNIGHLSRSAAVPWLTDWLSAGINTGLRPSEWATTVLEVRGDPNCRHGRRAWLYVLNAKANAGAIAIQRTLDISDFSDSAFDAVRRHAERASEWSLAQKFEMRHSQCAQLLYETCSALFPRQQQRYSLFSLRVQFIANMKTIYQPAEVAALVGHISSEDATVEHYGKRRAAWLREEICEVPVPMPAQVTRMHRQWELYEGRRKAKKLRQALLERRREARAKTKKPKPEL